MATHEETQLLRTSLNRFLDQHVAPFYSQWEEQGIMPKTLWQTLGEAGFLCVDMPAEYGGIGGDFQLSSAIIEIISQRGFASLATNLSVHSDIVAPYILNLGTEVQKQSWLPKLVSGGAVGAIAMTEPSAGSDLQAIQTQANVHEKGYLINGQKTFITNGQHSDLCIVAAKTNPKEKGKGLSLFLLDAKQDGFIKGQNLKKIGLLSGDTSELFFEDAYTDSVLGGLNHGFAHLMSELPRERLILAVGALGACDGMMKMTLDYVQQRQAFGKAISELQNTRFLLAELDTQISINKAYVEQCIQEYQNGTLDSVSASKAKLSTTELQCKVADTCLQLFGGYGYMQEYPISRSFLDARVQKIYGGTSEVMKEIIARGLLGASK